MAFTLIVILLLLTPIVTYICTALNFRKKQQDQAGFPPSIPYHVPFLAHTFTFAAGDQTLASAIRKHAITDSAVRFNGIGFDFVILSGTHLIRKALSAATSFDWNAISAPLYGSMFAGSDAVVQALREDNSGIGVKPYAESNVHPGRRLMRNQIIFFSDVFSRASLDELVPRFTQNVEIWCDAQTEIGTEWVEKSDLFQFVREIMFSCSVDALFGMSLRELNPNLFKDFFEYDDQINKLAMPTPDWTKRRVINARNRCHAAMVKWRNNAVEKNKDIPIDEDNEPPWNDIWGLTALRRRTKLYDGTAGLYGEQDRASTDLALLWSLLSNVLPASFWYVAEVLACDGLLERVQKEIQQYPTFNAFELTNNHLLQSICAEVLRHHVIVLITRTVKKPHQVNSWFLPKGQNITVSSNVEHFHEQWDEPNHPATEFWPERFLDEEGKFSLDGRQAQWLPFGFGEHMCPGRHFAKQEMIINFAVLMSVYDIELLTPKGWRPEDSYARYGFVTQQPKSKVPFRIRKRTSRSS